MLTAKTGTSVLEDAKSAGMEAAEKAKEGQNDIKMAYVYASCDYDLKALLSGISEKMPGVPLIGNTSYTGVITEDGFVTGDKGFVGMMAVSDKDTTVGVASVRKNGDSIANGALLAKKAMENAGKTTPPDYFYMAASPAEEEYYLKGITQVIGRVPFFGGSAADNTIAGNWQLFTDKDIFPDGCAVCFFYTDKKMANKYTGAYHETKDVGIITKLNGVRTLAEIDGMPALEKYASWRGLNIDDLRGANLLSASVVSPLGVKDRLGDLVAIRHPMAGNDDNTIGVGNNLAVNTAVIRMEATVDELIHSTGDTMKELKGRMDKPAYYLLVHCGGRRAGIGDRIGEVAEELKKEAGGVPFLTEFTFGEYGFEQDGMNTCGGLMLSFTGVEKE